MISALSIIGACCAGLFFAEGHSDSGNRALTILKPDAVAANSIGNIIARYEENGLSVIAAKMLVLSKEQARHFYAAHEKKPFFNELVNFITSRPVLLCVLEGDHAVIRCRAIMGATDPVQAKAGTIRADFGKNILENTVHGADSDLNATREIQFFFGAEELYPRPKG